MKLLFYSHTSKISGAEKILLLLINKLNRNRFAPSGVCSGAGPLNDALADLEVPSRSIPELEARFTVNPVKLLRYFLSVVKTARSLRREVVEIAPDLIHANSIRAGFVATASTLGSGIPVVWHLQDELGTHPISTIVRLFVLFSKRVWLAAASGQTLESFTGRLLRSDRIASRGCVVHNVVDADQFKFSELSRTAIRDEIGAGTDEFVFGVIGQVTPRKGQSELVEAFADCLEELPHARLVIVGEPMFNSDDDYLTEIKDLVQRRELSQAVRFLGFRDDVPELLSALDAVVINSKSEAFVVVGIEGLSTGVPVIATDVGGIREMMVDGESGLIVSFADTSQLKAAMIRIASDPELRERFRRNGRQIVKDRLNSTVFVESMEKFFGKAVADGNKVRVTRILDAESEA